MVENTLGKKENAFLFSFTLGQDFVIKYYMYNSCLPKQQNSKILNLSKLKPITE